MKVQACGTSKWEPHHHGLDLPHTLKSWDFRVSGRGHQHIDPSYRTYCDRSRRLFDGESTMPEDRLAAWLCRHASGFVFVETPTPRWTVISFLAADDAERFGDAWVKGERQ